MSGNSGVARSAGDESEVPVESNEALGEVREVLELGFSDASCSVSCAMDVTMAGCKRQVAAGKNGGVGHTCIRAETRRETEVWMEVCVVGKEGAVYVLGCCCQQLLHKGRE